MDLMELKMCNFCRMYLQVIERASRMQNFDREHLQWRINREYRYIRYQKIESTHPSIYFNHSTPQSKKKTMQSSELESGLPDEVEQECIVFSFLEAVEN